MQCVSQRTWRATSARPYGHCDICHPTNQAPSDIHWMDSRLPGTLRGF